MQYREALKVKVAEESRNIIENANNKGKAVWQVINKHRVHKKGNQRHHNNISLYNEKGIITDEPVQVCQLFNQYFADIPQLIGKDLKGKNFAALGTEQINHHHAAFIQNSLFLNPATEEEIVREIKKLSNSLSEGPDELSNSILRKCGHVLAMPLTHLINLSLTQGIFPELLKHTKICPLPKSENIHNKEEYRPLALTSPIAKLFERIFYSRIITFLMKNKILSKYQFGFLKGKSTIQAVNECIEFMIKQLKQRKLTSAIALDISKAFNCLNFQMLYEKLDRYGVRGVPLDWITSFMEERNQYVEIKSTCNGNIKKTSVKTTDNDSWSSPGDDIRSAVVHSVC